MKYTTVLLDLDQTILDFNKIEKYAISKVIEENGLIPTIDMIKQYHEIDMLWWEKFERGEVELENLLVNRFHEYFSLYGVNVNGSIVNKHYLQYLSDEVYYIDGAQDFLKELNKKLKIIVITNGLCDVQKRRLAKTDITKYFSKIYISENMPYRKPQKEFFDIVLKENNLTNKECIILGDSLTSDMRGGINASIDTCWFNQFDKKDTLGVKYIINKLDDFFRIINE